jgi:4-alpha-glucanotransferase
VTRLSGILLHPTSLPGPYGIGDIGPAAREFASTLESMGQSLWQMLPLGPTGYGDSPYQSPGSFAGNPLLISPDDLVSDGLLDPSGAAGAPGGRGERVDFGALIPWKTALLDRVAAEWPRRARPALRRSFEAFRAAEAGWLEDFALFSALKRENGGRAWIEWPAPLARREAAASRTARRRLAASIESARLQQFLFAHQWRRLRREAHRRGLRLVGDAPIFVAHDSVDVWANRHLFALDGDGNPTAVAGVPPDYFSATGQLWGNPLYRWDVHAAEGYAWWIARLRRVLAMVDLVRLDHFRGFEAYWEIPAGEPTAVHGRWVPGPRDRFLRALRAGLGGLPILAEDLGLITAEVRALRMRFRLPGMLVLQFTVEGLLETPPLVPEAASPNTAMYTGTHDNDTAAGWFHAAPGEGSTQDADRHRRVREAFLAHTGGDGRAVHWDMLGLAWRSPARMAVAPLQDVLGLGGEARMNLPGRPWGNWQWRMRPDAVTPPIAAQLRRLTAAHGRGPAPSRRLPRGPGLATLATPRG